ncbi:MAG: hypothetical protein JXB14_06370, partial [Candidatus Altiarchaeota archaeon]|nr:hypothetical protein [Candidatus Altiarchaeota archaeon]
NGTDMSCTIQGSIAKGYLHYNTTHAGDWTQMCALTDTDTDTCGELQSNFDLADGAASNKKIFWVLRAPTGVSGTCTGHVTFTAIAS